MKGIHFPPWCAGRAGVYHPEGFCFVKDLSPTLSNALSQEKIYFVHCFASFTYFWSLFMFKRAFLFGKWDHFLFVRVSPCYKSVSYLSARDYLHVINVSSRPNKSMTPYLINVKRYFSLHNSRFMNQARRTRHLLKARVECEAWDEGWRKIKL